MKVIARIPEARPPVMAAEPVVRTADRPATTPRLEASAFKHHWTVAVLAALAMVAWGLASWNDARRAAGQRQPARIAAQPPSVAAPLRAIGP
jgi:hypothetical protein